MTSGMQLAHYGLRTHDLPRATEWYSKVLSARTLYQDDLLAFMSFDHEHHRMVIWNDGETSERPSEAGGVDHVGYSCGGPEQLADEYDRLSRQDVMPFAAVNHGFTSSLYYHDPDGNEVEITCDNFPTKEECANWFGSDEAKAVITPPLFGREFDPEKLLEMRKDGRPLAQMARVGFEY